MVGTKSKNILNKVSDLIEDQGFYKSMVKKKNPFGDGNASKRIVDVFKDYFANKIAN